MISGNVVRSDGLFQELWHFTLSPDLTLFFHKYELLKFQYVEFPGHEWLKLWKYPDLKDESNISEPSVPPWAIQDAKTLILTKIKIS